MRFLTKADAQRGIERLRDLEGMVAAIERSQAVIEFELDGTIVRANDNFLQTLGYAESEVVGRRHAMFVDPAELNGEAYREFWRTLNRGEFVAAKFRRLGKGGREVWIQASYNPIFGPDVSPCGWSSSRPTSPRPNTSERAARPNAPPPSNKSRAGSFAMWARRCVAYRKAISPHASVAIWTDPTLAYATTSIRPSTVSLAFSPRCSTAPAQ